MSREYSINLGKQLRRLTIETNTAFVINDDISLARELGADGVHLGQDDESVAIARQALGEDAIIGVSAGTPEEAGKAIEDGADYLGVGAIFATASKADAGEPIGVAGLRQIVERVNGRIPVVAIGGIGLQNAKQCRMAGADGVAVVSAIMGSHEPDIVASSLHAILGESIDI